ncbi:MAG: Gfo/Idh/MocA family oxidoreductase [Chloroflexi bacterium]|nr:Gfo/Idh/MocA family oxidoreductase [Chloroflexota bacterium]
MSSKIRAGVIGLGILGSSHADYLAKRPDVDLVALADLRMEAAEAVAQRLGVKAYNNYESMLAAEKLDLVVVATPDPLHRAPTVASLEAGVPNILQEKPFATTRADADAIYEAVRKHKAHFFINFANRVAPLDIATRYAVQAGLLGRVVYGESRLDDNISVPTKMWGSRTKDWAAGSSTAFFLLSHVVDLLRFYFAPAEVREVYAISQREVLGYTPDLYDAFLTFDSGLKVRVKAEWIKHIDDLVEFYMCFSGADGTLIYNKRGAFGCEPGWRANINKAIDAQTLLTHQTRLAELGVNVAAKLHRPSPEAGALKAGGGELLPALEFYGLGYSEWMALDGLFIDAIQEDTLTPKGWQNLGPLPSLEDGMRQFQVVDAIVRSAEIGKVITLD